MMGDQSFAYHEGIKCEETKDEIIGARYFTHCFVKENVEKRFNYSEEAFFNVKDSDMEPLIYIRLARPL